MASDEIPTGPTEAEAKAKAKERWYEVMDYDYNPISVAVCCIGAVAAFGTLVFAVVRYNVEIRHDEHQTEQVRLQECGELDSEIAKTFCITEGG